MTDAESDLASMTDEEFEERYELRNIGPGNYDRMRETFEWDGPDMVNMAVEICDRWADDRGRVALYWEDADGTTESFTFYELSRLTNQCANAFQAQGIGSGNIVALLLPNVPEYAIATIATHKLGAINMPLYHLFGPDGLTYRFTEAQPDIIVTDSSGLKKLTESGGVPGTVFVTDDSSTEVKSDEFAVESFWTALDSRSRSFTPVETAPTDPAQLFYTSGTTGDPKGVLQAHQYVVAHRHIGQYMRDFHPDDLVWHAGNLAWAGGFVNLIEAWSIGMPMLKYRGRFDPERTLELLEAYDVDLFVTAPTALRQLMDLPPERIESFDIDLRMVFTGGERVTPDVLRWADTTFDAFATTGWGQTECYGLGWQPVGAEYPEKQGTLGKPLPGFEAAVLDDDGEELPPGTVGELAIGRENNPSMFLGYYDDPEATDAVTEGGWHRTGDSVEVDADGYYWFKGRKDDIIISSGYRLSPTEIEGSLNVHPAVSEAAVVGVPNEERTNIVKAFIEVSPGYEASEALATELQRHVKDELAKFQYPRQIEFVDELPKTITGKIKRQELANERA